MDRFQDSSNEATIEQLLSHLADGFHSLENLEHTLDSGFRVALRAQQQLIEEIRNDFARGDKRYANQRLRALSSNCIACHSRFSADTQFFGASPPNQQDTLSKAEFLFATRQFHKASDLLLSYAEDLKEGPFFAEYAMQALKLWLVIEVRVLKRFDYAASVLDDWDADSIFVEPQSSVVRSWAADLRLLAASRRPAKPLVIEARSLLAGEINGPIDEEKELVKTLRATVVLHQYLEGPALKRAEATYLLALAYNRLPIDALSPLRDLYLEEVMLGFPKSGEAQQAYALYRKNKREVYGKSLPPDVDSRLRELARLLEGRIEQ